MAEAISLAKEFNDIHGLAVALCFAADLGYIERDAAELERLASDLIELSTRHSFSHWRCGGVFIGWARAIPAVWLKAFRGSRTEYKTFGHTGAYPGVPLLSAKAEALHLADRTCEALEAIQEAEALIEDLKSAGAMPNCIGFAECFLRLWCDDTQIEDSFRAAISTAKQQKSLSLEKRAEATYAGYCRQKAST